MSWSSGEELYIEIIELLLRTKGITDVQALCIAADLKLLFEAHDCDSIEVESTVHLIMDHYYPKEV